MSDYDVLTAAARPYLVAVLSQLADEKIPATGYGFVDGERLTADRAEAEAEGWIDIPTEEAVRHYGPDMAELGVYWDSLSGWHVYGEYRTDPGKPFVDVKRWMGAGLVPEPERVAGFIATVLVDYTMTGSAERPFYRGQGEAVPVLAERLKHYQRP